MGGRIRTTRQAEEFEAVVLARKRQASFYDVLSSRQKENMLIEEVQTRERTGIRHLSDDTLKKLMLSIAKDARQVEEKRHNDLVGSHSYDILADRENARDLLYIPHHYPERTMYLPHFTREHESDVQARQDMVDKVRLAVDLAYLDEQVARSLSFRYFDRKVLKQGKSKV